MSENIIEQLKAAASQPEPTLEEYKETRANESFSNHREETIESKHQEKEVEEKVTETEPEEKEYEPWKEKKETEEQEDEEDEDVIVTDSDQKVPLKKLLKLKAAKKERDAELLRTRAQLAEYEAIIKKALPKEEAEVVVDPIERKMKELKEPNPNDYDSWETYHSARQDYTQSMKELEHEQMVKRIEDRFTQKKELEQKHQENEKKVMDFVNRVEEASKTNPDIKHAIGWFEKNMMENGGLNSIEGVVREALTTDDNSPELIYRVVKDRDLIAKIFSKQDSVSVLKKIGKISAYIELEKDDEGVGNEVEYVAPKKKNVPKTVGGMSSGSYKSSSKAEDVSEYKKLRAKELEMERKGRR